MFYNSLNLEK